jgi:hypothetical protein
LSTPMAGSRTVSLSGKLGFVKAEHAQTTDGVQERLILGLGEGQNDPEWRFRATSSQKEIVGIYRLQIIVRASSGVHCQASIIVAATVRRRRAGLISYRAELPPQLADVRFPL